ncbi:MAG: HAD family hydrolase [Chloroflexi bacterium]|nr:MAG: HAD family hydrolase [Chloroflexota bacterium]
MTQFECQAILFDLDGTLVDSTASVERSWRRWTERVGLDFAYVMAIAHGRPAFESLRIVAPHLSLAEEAAWLEDQEAADAHTVKAIAGAQSLLKSFPDNRWCIVTSGTDRLARARVYHAGLPLPNVLVTADDVTNGKPDPEPYLVGAQRMALSPSACVVLEDSVAGVASAKAAGMRVIAVTTTHTPDVLQAADLIIDSLSDLQVTISANGIGDLLIRG